jgi:cysteinyl-tRNA synthetase
LDEAKKLQPEDVVISALADDLNTHEALRGLSALNGAGDASRLARNIEFLGLMSWKQIGLKVAAYRAALYALPALAERLQSLREVAKLSKDFSAVDNLKRQIAAANFSVMMSKTVVTIRPEMDFDLAKLEALK